MTVKVQNREELRQAVRDKRIVILVKGQELAEYVYYRKRRYRWMLFWCILTLTCTVALTFVAQSALDTTVVELIGPDLFLNSATSMLGAGVLAGMGFATAAFTNPFRSYRYIKRTLRWAIIHRV